MGSSKKQTVGYKYYLGSHLVFCYGPVDRWSRLTFDGERIAWTGAVTELTRAEDVGAVNVSAPNLFGGDDIGKEGGVSGFVDFEPGETDQTKNPYLQAQLGSDDIPAFRTVVGLVFRQFYFGATAYFKKVSARFTRVHKTTLGAEQWYDGKAEISSGLEVFAIGDLFRWIIDATSALDFSAPGFDDSSWDEDPGGFGQTGQFVNPQPPIGTPNGGIAPGSIWLRKHFTNIQRPLRINVYHDNTPTVWINGVLQTLVTVPEDPLFRSYVIVDPANLLPDNVIALKVLDLGSIMYAGLEVHVEEQADMNPAHIIRECLTDTVWGMGYNEADVDDTTFEAAADQLFTERMGISILWDQSMAIEDFIKEIVRHIDAALYVDRVTGKFTLKLIRGGYTVGALPLFDPSNIEKLEDFNRPSFGELVNSVTVNYWDSVTGKQASLTVEDPALVLMQGATINTTVQYPGFTNPDIAGRAGLRDLQTLSNPLASCTITAGSDAESLAPGGLFRLNWPEYGIVNMPMRVVGIAYGDGVSHKVKMQVTQDSFALPEVGIIQPPDVGWTDPNGPPIASPYQLAIEMPYVELLQQLGLSGLEGVLSAAPEVGYAGLSVSRPTPNAINAKFMLDNGAGYEQVGVLQFTPIALLAAALPQEKGPTVIAIDNGIDIDLALELGAVGSWCQIGGELCIVEALSTTSITLGRGTLDTTPAPHADNSTIFLWDNFAQNDDEQYALGEEVNMKALTVTGSGELPIASAPAQALEIVARAIRPYPPADLVVDGSDYPTDVDFEFDVTWVARNRLTQGDTLLDTNEATVTAEASTTYTVRTYLDDVLIDEVDSITDLFLNDINIPGNGLARVEVWAVRDSYESYQPLWAEFDYVGAVQFVSTDVPDGQDGVPFSFELEIEGGLAPFVFTVESGDLPDGLTLDPDTGEISGTPTVQDTFNYTLRVTDDNAEFDELIVEQEIAAGIVYATWDPATHDGNITLSGGNLTANQNTGGAWHSVRSTIGKSSGKWYWELTIGTGDENGFILGVAQSGLSQSSFVGSDINSYGFHDATSFSQILKWTNGGFSGTGEATWTNGDVISIALDMDNAKIWWAKNGVFVGDPVAGTGAPFTGIAGTQYAALALFGLDMDGTANFGASAFAYTPPTGFVGLSA